VDSVFVVKKKVLVSMKAMNVKDVIPLVNSVKEAMQTTVLNVLVTKL